MSLRTLCNRAIALAAVTAAAVVAVSGPAVAAPSSGDRNPTEVTVHSPGGLNVRTSPKAGGPVVSHLGNGDRIYVACKVKGQKIRGNDVWYLTGKLAPDAPGNVRGGWISASYVSGPAPDYCPGSSH
jgi:hypothetical protein